MYITADYHYIVLEYCKGGELFDRIIKKVMKTSYGENLYVASEEPSFLQSFPHFAPLRP